jgi:hypothetical protein
MKLEFSRHILEKYSTIDITWQAAQWGLSCYMRTDRQTHMTKLIVAFRQFANAPHYYVRHNFSLETSILTMKRGTDL